MPRRATSPWSAAASPASGRRFSPKRGTRPRRPPARGGARRLGRLRAQRRFRDGDPHPRRPHGKERFPDELAELDRLGLANLDAIEAAVARYGIDCDWERTGELLAAVEPWQVQGCREEAELLRASGYDAVFIDGEDLRAEIKSPLYLGGFWDRDGCAMVDPARLAWGLRRACAEAGVRLAEGTPVLDLERDARRVRLKTPAASVSAARVALGTNAFLPLLKRLRLWSYRCTTTSS